MTSPLIILLKVLVILIIFIASYLFYRLTKGGSKAWRIFIFAALLFVFSGPVFDFFYSFKAVTLARAFRTFLFSVVPSTLFSYSFMYLYKDIQQEGKKKSTLNLIIFDLVYLSAAVIFGFYSNGFGGFFTILHILSPVILLLPAVYWSYKLWKGSRRVSWLIFIVGYFFHFISLTFSFYQNNVCGTGAKLAETSLCEFKAFLQYSVVYLPYNEFLMHINTYPLLYVAISLYGIGFIILMLSIWSKGKFVSTGEVEDTLANKVANKAVKKVGDIVGIPLAFSIASQAAEEAGIENGVKVGRNKLNITSDKNDLKVLKKFVNSFAQRSKESIGPNEYKVILNTVEKESEGNKELQNIYKNLLANKILRDTIERVGNIIKKPVAYRIASLALKDSDMEKEIEIEENRIMIVSEENSIEIMNKFLKLFKEKSYGIIGPTGPRLIKETINRHIDEYPELKKIED